MKITIDSKWDYLLLFAVGFTLLTNFLIGLAYLYNDVKELTF